MRTCINAAPFYQFFSISVFRFNIINTVVPSTSLFNFVSSEMYIHVYTMVSLNETNLRYEGFFLFALCVCACVLRACLYEYECVFVCSYMCVSVILF